MDTETTPAAKITVDCPKCDGKGRIRGFDHVCGGVCFECEGTRKIEVDAMTAAEINQTKIGHLYYLADIVLAAAEDLNDKRAEFYMHNMVEDMLAVGTVAAREVLEYIRQGRWENYNLGESGRLDQATAAEWHHRLIQMGREAIAQDEDRCQDSADLERDAA